MSNKYIRVRMTPGCGAQLDYIVEVRLRCTHNNKCQNRPRYIALYVYPMYNEVDKERTVCEEHIVHYNVDEKKRKCVGHSYHWHTYKIPQPVKMLWRS